MPISWNEIRHNAINFSREWAGVKSESAEKQTFWNEFFQVFGIKPRVVASFEEPVKKISGDYGFIDLFWPGVLLVEHKSFGQDTRRWAQFPALFRAEHEICGSERPLERMDSNGSVSRVRCRKLPVMLSRGVVQGARKAIHFRGRIGWRGCLGAFVIMAHFFGMARRLRPL